MSKNLKVIIPSNDCPQVAIHLLEKHFTVVYSQFSGYLLEDADDNDREVNKLANGASAFLWMSSHAITAQLLDAAGPQLKIVATASAGYNHCNVAELRSRGVKLSNTPEVLSAAVADVAVMLLLGTARRVIESVQQVKTGKWLSLSFQGNLGVDVRDSTVGVIGLGGIGQAAMKRLAGFEVGQFLYTGHNEKPEAGALGAKFVSLDELLKSSDFVLLTCPLTDETRHIVNERSLAKMKSNAIIVNVGRGELIDQEALYKALKNRQIYGAGLDVTTPEPLPADHPLLTLPNAFILPHIGSATTRTREDMAVLAAKNIIQALQDKPLITPILP